jgi:catalase
MALLFQLPNGEEWRTGMNNIPVFPVRNAQEFHDQMLASAPDPATGKPDPAKFKAFAESHPATAQAMPLIQNRPISSGFENSAYNSLNAFRFIDAKGTVTPVRWSMVPDQPFEPISTSDLGKADKNYLFDRLIAAIHKGPQTWRLIVTIGEPGDPTNDATLPWPANRRQIELGTLTIDSVESEDVSPARDINFDPLILPDGIAGSDDPLLSARSATYSQSFKRREGERKIPSAVSTAETEQ